MNDGRAVRPDETLTHGRFFALARGGHPRRQDTEAEIARRGEPHGSARRSTLVTPLEQVRLLSLLELSERLGPVLFRADQQPMEHGGQDPASRAEPCVLHRVDQWSAATARAFALDCAERVLPILGWHAPDDDRPARLLASARAALSGHWATEWRHRAWKEACVYEADIAEHSCHPAITPAARACVAAVQACAWGAVRTAVINAREAEASRVAWDAAWTAARDAVWFACTAAETDALSAASWNRAWRHVTDEVRAWQAITLARHLGLTGQHGHAAGSPALWSSPE